MMLSAHKAAAARRRQPSDDVTSQPRRQRGYK
jgi:hypothetical protein